ncbi:hypothetical protein HAX54_044141 [Datura stramonium]|uniref:Uncharacterized protein n=1 Tax=Datura stramonium TaxID=4076 RepID=A0ABS8W291_DATST|nr:hypothetical protein [Datura stramonium]
MKCRKRRRPICSEQSWSGLIRNGVRFYQEKLSIWLHTLLSSQGSVLEDEILETIPSLVTEEDNKMLTSLLIWKKFKRDSSFKGVSPVGKNFNFWKEGNSENLENPISQPAAIIQKITDWLKDCSQLLDIRSSGRLLILFFWRLRFIKPVNSQLTPKSLLIASMKIKKPLKLPIPRLTELHLSKLSAGHFKSIHLDQQRVDSLANFGCDSQFDYRFSADLPQQIC